MIKKRVFPYLILLSISFFFLTGLKAQYRNLEIKAAGLTCSLCSNAIQKALKSLPFVADVQTELKSNLFKIELRPGAAVNLDLISMKVEDAGFSVGSLTVEVKFSPSQIKQDAHIVANGQLYHFLNVKPQQINGWQKIRLLDKNFVLSAEAKKNAKLTQMPCFKTGITASCCHLTDYPAGKRVFHVTTI